MSNPQPQWLIDAAEKLYFNYKLPENPREAWLAGATCEEAKRLHQNEWISVEDQKKPNEGEYVLIHGKGGRRVAALYKTGGFIAYDIFSDDLMDCEEVTHWQRLPSPPINDKP